MNVLARKAYLGLAKLAGVLAIALFASAGTLAYWQAWLYLANILGASVFITRYLSVNDPALLERRLQTPAAERRRSQRLIQLVASVGYVALHIVSALDRRFGWCPVATWLSLAAEVLVAWGFWVVFRVFEANSYSSSIIEIGENQRVVDTGPYARVRHPMSAAHPE